MSTQAELVADLVASLSTAYPARVAAVSNRPGRVTAVVVPTTGTWETPVCPGPVELEADIHVLAATSDEAGVVDLLHHLDPVAELARQAGFTTARWRAGNEDDRPEIVVTVIANAIG